MQVKFDDHPWPDGEAYRIRLDGGGEGDDPAVGFAWRVDANTWRFASGDKFDPEAKGPTIEAATVEQARALIAERFHTIEIPNDRLSNERMHDITSQMLLILSELAKRASARPGYVSALAEGVARHAVTEMRPDGDAQFLEAFQTGLTESIKGLREITERRHAFAATFAELFKQVIDDEPDDTSAMPTH